MTRINRDEWQRNFYRETAEVYTSTNVSPGRVDIDFDSGRSDVSAYFSPDFTDIRIGDLQFVVGVGSLVVLRQHGPYPIQEWTVIYDGPLPKKEAA